MVEDEWDWDHDCLAQARRHGVAVREVMAAALVAHRAGGGGDRAAGT